jgi:hypothetical protein
MKTSPENGISVITFVLGQGPRQIPISMATAYWPSLCTKQDAQKTCDAIRAFDTSAKGGPDSVTIEAQVMDFSGQGEFSDIVIPDASPVRNFCVAGKATKGGVDYVIDEYGALVPDQLQTGWTVPKPTDVLKMTINDSSGIEFSWG